MLPSGIACPATCQHRNDSTRVTSARPASQRSQRSARPVSRAAPHSAHTTPKIAAPALAGIERPAPTELTPHTKRAPAPDLASPVNSTVARTPRTRNTAPALRSRVQNPVAGLALGVS